jgi:hypothetical protein
MSSDNNTKNKKKSPLQQFVAGGCAGLVESSVCHPLDTIKTRMQLRRQTTSVEKVVVQVRHSLMDPALRLKHSLQEPRTVMVGGHLHEPGMHLTGLPPPARPVPLSAANAHVVQAPLGPIGTARRIVQREGFFALYKGLTAVYTGIIPKMAIRFLSFEQYREVMTRSFGNAHNATQITFVAGLFSGLTEAIMVVTPAEVCKIRMQSQYHSLMDPAAMQHRKYTNVVQTAFVIVKEEGLGALYKGVVPTMLRQGCNQAVNFTAYNKIKQRILEWQGKSELDPWQSLLLGGLSGGLGPLANNPLDV